MVESIRRRHNGERRNPWNEPECGHHYARALASWGPMLALSGFLYDRPGKCLQAKPRVNTANFNSFWSMGTGWGVFSQVVRDGQLRFTLSVKSGSLVARTVRLSRLGAGGSHSTAAAGKTELAHQIKRSATDVVVTFAEDVNLAEGDRLVIEI